MKLKGLGDYEPVVVGCTDSCFIGFVSNAPQNPELLGQAEDVTKHLKSDSGLRPIKGALDALMENEFNTVLDVGCYGGYVFDYLKARRSDFLYTGIDIQEDVIEEAIELHKEHGPDCEFRCADLFNLPLPFNRAFDVVFCSRVAIHLPDLGLFVDKLLEVTGKLLIFNVKLADKNIVQRYRVGDKGYFYLYLVTEESVAEILAERNLDYEIRRTPKYATVIVRIGE